MGAVNINKTILIFTSIGILFIIQYLYISQYKIEPIKLSKVSQVTADTKLTGTWWFMVKDKDDAKIAEYGIKLPKVEFDKNNLIISGGREIKKIEYKSQLSFPFFKSHFAKVTLSRQAHPYTWFIYKIHKIDVYHDEHLPPEADILLE
jgi:hypothetical protein